MTGTMVTVGAADLMIVIKVLLDGHLGVMLTSMAWPSGEGGCPEDEAV